MTFSKCLRFSITLGLITLLTGLGSTAMAYNGVLLAQVDDEDSKDEKRMKPIMRTLSPSIRRLRPDSTSVKVKRDKRVLDKDVSTRGSKEKEGRKKSSSSSKAKKVSSSKDRADSTPAADSSWRTRAEVDSIDYKARSKKAKVSFDYKDVTVEGIVKAISELTKRNFIIPEKIKGQKLTILSPTKITPAEAYQVFLAALAINDITIVKVGKFYKLVSSKDAIKQPIPTCVGDADKCPKYNDQMITTILKIENIDAAQIEKVIKGLISKQGNMVNFSSSNSLIISEYASNITRIRKIIASLDVAGFDDELKLVQIEYATASEIADKITQIFDVQASGKRKSTKKGKSSSDDSKAVTISKIISDERTNQLIIKANKRSFEAIAQLIAQLDVPINESEQGRIHVHYLENAKAEDLASTLSSLAQSASKSSSARKGKGKKTTTGSAQLFSGEVKITADKSTNSLIVVAGSRDFRALRRLIEQLDRPRLQVYLEAAILEVSASNNEDFKLHWHAPAAFSKEDLGGLGGNGSYGFASSSAWSNSQTVSPTLLAMNPAGLLEIAGGSLAGVIGQGLDLKGPDGSTLITIPAFGLILQWLEQSSNAHIVSTPHILTLDNEEATIEVGQRVPFQRGANISTGSLAGLAGLAGGSGASGAAGALGGLAGLGGLGGLGGGGLFNSVERIDVSLKLSITPQINERNKIRLEVEQQFEDIVDRQAGTPTTANRAIKSVVVVDDQQTIVIGGLIRDSTKRSDSKVPFLGDLPLIGRLFRSQFDEVEKRNLLLILTPYIIRNASDFQQILERKMQEYEEFSAEYYGARADYRAHIDYSRKRGPLANLVRAIDTEMSKVENGGDGGSEELLIKPSNPSADTEVSDEASRVDDPGEAKGAESDGGVEP